MPKVTKQLNAFLFLNTEQGGGWLSIIDMSVQGDITTYSDKQAWKNASAGKRYLKRKVQELTPRKSIKMSPVKFDANEKPIEFAGSVTFKADSVIK